MTSSQAKQAKRQAPRSLFLNKMKAGPRILIVQCFFELFRQFWHNFEDVANQSVSGMLEYRGIRVFIDGNNNLGR